LPACGLATVQHVHMYPSLQDTRAGGKKIVLFKKHNRIKRSASRKTFPIFLCLALHIASLLSVAMWPPRHPDMPATPRPIPSIWFSPSCDKPCRATQVTERAEVVKMRLSSRCFIVSSSGRPPARRGAERGCYGKKSGVAQ
jgi:hypothetical protein